MLLRLLIILLVIQTGEAWCQSALEIRAFHDLLRQRWSKCERNLTKALEKDSLSVAAHYIKAHYFFSEGNPQFNLDSAYSNLSAAFIYYDQLTLRQRERLAKVPVDSFYLRELRRQIDSAAFVRARTADTEAAYEHFLEHYPTSVNYSDAILFLHDAGYRIALEENTYESFDRFLKKYPHSQYEGTARASYERLLFEFQTSDKQLVTYQRYVHENPQSPYRRAAEEQILEIASASGDLENFQKFIKNYPNSKAAVKARNILYYLYKETDRLQELVMSDSLMEAHQLNQRYVVPFYSSGHYGLMNSQGEEVMPAIVNELNHQYLCGNIDDDVIVFDNKLSTRDGKVFFQQSVEEAEELGLGFILIMEENGTQTIIHKSGYRITSGDLQDVSIVDSHFLAVKEDEHWGLYALTGRRLLQPEWDEIKNFHHILALRKANQWYLLTYKEVGLIANQQAPDFSKPYDEVSAWTENLTWVKRNEQEGLLDNNLNYVHMPEARALKQYPFGFSSESSLDIQVYLFNNNLLGDFQEIKTNLNWVGVRVNNEWKLFDTSSQTYAGKSFDSLSFSGTFPVAHKRDSITIFFSKNNSLSFKSAITEFISGKDSLAYVLVTSGGKKLLYNAEAKHLFTSAYDNIQSSSKGIFIVTKKGKKGLVAQNGKILLPIVYDAIGDGDGSFVPLLKGAKFGLYDLINNKELRPDYDKNLRRYDSKWFVADKKGGYGLVNQSNKMVIPFEYEDIQHWNDSAAWMKKNSMWTLVDINSQKIILDEIRMLSPVKDLPSEKITIIQQGSSFGVISSTRGLILPLTFTDIVNVGSTNEPFYFTEKHVEEGHLFVVIYYDKDGRLLRRQVYEPEEYERIYCSNN